MVWTRANERKHDEEPVGRRTLETEKIRGPNEGGRRDGYVTAGKGRGIGKDGGEWSAVATPEGRRRENQRPLN